MNSFLITARKRSLGQGNIFTRVCQEFCSQGGLVPGGGWSWGAWLGGVGVPGPGGVCSRGVPGEEPPLPRDGYCCGRYASYWNAFLLMWVFDKFHHCEKFTGTISFTLTMGVFLLHSAATGKSEPVDSVPYIGRDSETEMPRRRYSRAWNYVGEERGSPSRGPWGQTLH